MIRVATSPECAVECGEHVVVRGAARRVRQLVGPRPHVLERLPDDAPDVPLAGFVPEQAFPEACEALHNFRSRGGTVILITNAPRPADSVQRQLRKLGVADETYDAIVVGGGPTGVEFAAELHDFLEEDLVKAFPRLRQDVRITLLEATDQILNSFDATLGKYTMKQFRRSKIDVRTGSIVTRVDATHVHVKDGSTFAYGLLVWSTGIGPTAFVKSLPFEKERNNRIIVDEYFRVKGYENIYAAGDCAVIAGENYPATAQVAQQEGKYLARQFNRIAKGKPPEPFLYRNLGMLAYIGGYRALADLPNVKGSGYLTWLFWRSAYLTRLVSIKNKILVMFDWTKTIIFGRDISRF